MKDGLCPDMPFMVNDWLSSSAVTLMTLAQQGAYMRLLCHAWNDPNCNLIADPARLAVLSGLGADWDTGSGAVVLACFSPDPERPGFVFNPAQRAVRQRQDERRTRGRKRAQEWRDKKAATTVAAGKEDSKKASDHNVSVTPASPLSSPVSRLPSPKFSKENLPAALAASPRFLEEWDLWVEFRSKEKRNPLKPSSVHSQLKDLAQMGVEGAIASLRQSIKQGWTGLFEPKDAMSAGAIGPPKPQQAGAWLPNPLDSL